MSYCLACGKGATAIGIGCVSVGDNVHTQGAWQVALGADLSLAELGSDPKVIRDLILSIRGLLSLYQSFSDQAFAPATFFPKAKAVLEHLIGIMTRRAEELEGEARILEEAAVEAAGVPTPPKEKEDVLAPVEVLEEEKGVVDGGTKKRRNRNKNKK
jgi:hypothetical protein